jgi:hypothetical protein
MGELIVERSKSTTRARLYGPGMDSPPSKHLRRRNFLTFALGALSFLYINVGGQLYATEILLALALLLTLPLVGRPRLGAGIGLGLIIWVLGTLMSDLAAESDSMTLLKGLLRVLFLAVDVFAIYYLCASHDRAIQFLWLGIAAAAVLAFFLNPTEYSRGEPWKFGFALPFTLLVVLWLVRKDRPRMVSSVVFLSLGALHFFLGFRSMASIVLVCGLLIAVQVSSRANLSVASLPVRLRPALLSIAGGGGVIILSATYDRLALQGAFGYIAKQKAGFQSGEFGSILSSRSEFLLSFQSIADRPLLGGGSYSVASDQSTNSAAAFFSSYGYSDVAERLLRGAPAYHSEILGSWAENGILTLAFWIPFAVLLVGGIFAVVYRETAQSELVLFVYVLGLWDLFFSPFGADRRLWVAATICTIVLARTHSISISRGLNARNLHSHNQFQSVGISQSMP